jgi:hypothetical protein
MNRAGLNCVRPWIFFLCGSTWVRFCLRLLGLYMSVKTQLALCFIFGSMFNEYTLFALYVNPCKRFKNVGRSKEMKEREKKKKKLA